MSELSEKLEREILPLVSRPSRYIGQERNAVVKDAASVDLTFLLAFPDVYEIGMSHLGIRVLYDILNRRAEIAAERAYAPWPDMEALMREKGVPLFSMETHRPAREFDVIGFTLQYELHHTTILAMLDLAGVPVRARDRGEGDPVIVGGGPCALNPEPVAPFFDCLVLGDGESAILDLADHLIEARREGRPRGETVAGAAWIPGVYVPSLYEPRYADGRFVGIDPIDDRAPTVVRRRVESSLDASSLPCAPIVPITESTHDRLAIEIARGCTRGCRFCQAGMVTRPVRERSVDEIVENADRGLAASGYDTVSLVSLSPSDYGNLPLLIARLNERFFDRRVSISLPSLRADRFSLELADGIARVRKAGLTFAPEAGTQRLRDVVNKNETEDHILETVETTFEAGWSRVKLYFMIGLPTETDEDITGIIDLVKKVRRVAWSRRRGAFVNVSVSPFVPKPHTPFQWEAQDDAEEIRRKERLIRNGLRIRGVKVATRDPEVSLLEAVLARGDRRLADLLEKAWRAGARLEGWTEHYDFGIWRGILEGSGLDIDAFRGAIDPASPLPWDHIDAGPSKAFLRRERERALRGETTADCRDGTCAGCGVCAVEQTPSREMPAAPNDWGASSAPVPYGRSARRGRRVLPGTVSRWRIAYEKGASVRHISHLDIVRAVNRALAASGLPVVYSHGYNPHPKVSFGPPLPVGATGGAEFFDVDLASPVTKEEIERRFARGLPSGLRLVRVVATPNGQSGSSDVAAVEYEISEAPELRGLRAAEIARRIRRVRGIEAVSVRRGAKVREIRPREGIVELEAESEDPPVLRALLVFGARGAVGPRDVTGLLAGAEYAEGAEEPLESGSPLGRIHRRGFYRRVPGPAGRLEPL